MKGPASTLIVDDELLARKRLRRLLEQRSDVSIVGECRNGLEAIGSIRSLRPDLLFLDVQMPDLDGVGVLERVDPATIGAVVFVTAYDRYALRAFDLHAVDYLLKPFTDNRFSQALDRALGRIRRTAAESLRDSILSAVDHYRTSRQPAVDPADAVSPAKGGKAEWPDASRRHRLTVRSSGRTRFIDTEAIDWLEAAGSYVRIHAGPQKCLIRASLAQLAAALPSERFARIHRSTVVNIERVVEVRNQSHREMTLILADGTELKLSRTYRDSAGPRLGLP